METLEPDSSWSLAALRLYVHQYLWSDGIKVRTNTGGPNGRTKSEFVRDIRRANKKFETLAGTKQANTEPEVKTTEGRVDREHHPLPAEIEARFDDTLYCVVKADRTTSNPGAKGLCGIYELYVMEKRGGRFVHTPVYVGMTNNFRRRLGDHVGMRTNTSKFMRECMDKQQCISWRHAATTSETEARRLEREILAAYNYAWNTAENEGKREVKEEKE